MVTGKESGTESPSRLEHLVRLGQVLEKHRRILLNRTLSGLAAPLTTRRVPENDSAFKYTLPSRIVSKLGVTYLDKDQTSRLTQRRY